MRSIQTSKGFGSAVRQVRMHQGFVASRTGCTCWCGAALAVGAGDRRPYRRAGSSVILEGKPIGNVERLAAGALRLRYDEGYRDDPTATLFSSRCSAPRLVATVLEPCSSAHPLRLTILSVDLVRSRGSPRPPLPQDCGRFKPTRPAGSAPGSPA